MNNEGHIMGSCQFPNELLDIRLNSYGHGVASLTVTNSTSA